MTSQWKSEDCRDVFGQSIQTLVDKKLKAGEGKEVTVLEDAANDGESNEVVLTVLLAKCLQKWK